jgi:hypothetical protein
MKLGFSKSQIAMAAVAALSATALGTASNPASAAKVAGTYAAGDFHNHTTCSDGSTSMQRLVKKSIGGAGDGYGLDWFVQAGHGGTGNRNCSLTEDASLDTPAYPFVAGTGPTTTWQNTPAAANGPVAVKGAPAGGVAPNANMWRWQSLQEFQYPVMEYLATLRDKPLFLGLESVVAGHEHTSMSVITGQLPASLNAASLPTAPNTLPGTSRYTAVGNANALAQWSYCFDRGDTDTSRGTAANNWDCSVTGSLNSGSPDWNATAFKLGQGAGAGTGNKGHTKTVEAVKWMAEFHPNGSYYIPAHLERAGQFNPNGNNGFNVEHLRNFNNAAPKVAFGMESQPGHGASQHRGEYQPNRQTINGVLTDSVGTTTYGGTGVYGALVGGVWDALLGEGRNFWFFASSDWHNRGSFGADDRRTTQDFLPGEYQRNYTMVRNGGSKTTPQHVVDGLRTGNNWAASGQLIDRMAFIACASYPGPAFRSNASVEALALTAAQTNTDIDKAGCATMGEKLVVRPGADIVVSIVVRDPAGPSSSPYTFNNPSLLQVGINQPLHLPVVDHIDVIRGMVTGYKTPGAIDYSGQWPSNVAAGAWPGNGAWLDSNPGSATFGQTLGLVAVPVAAKNTSAAVLKTFNATGGASNGWTSSGEYLKMTFRIPAVAASQYLRLRGTNLPPSVPFETDADGNPLSDIFTNSGNPANLRIVCGIAPTTPIPAGTFTGTTDGCPAHLATAAAPSPIAGQRAVSFDVAAWADLWFYSNPVFVEVTGSTAVAGVK